LRVYILPCPKHLGEGHWVLLPTATSVVCRGDDRRSDPYWSVSIVRQWFVETQHIVVERLAG